MLATFPFGTRAFWVINFFPVQSPTAKAVSLETTVTQASLVTIHKFADSQQTFDLDKHRQRSDTQSYKSSLHKPEIANRIYLEL